MVILVKKYSNRRLYDTGDSRYITLEDLAQKIRAGAEVRVVDAASGEDLTQATLTQLILESRGASRLLPVPVLVRLVRMGDDALAEFFGRFVSWALEVYLQVKQGAQSMSPYNPFAGLPYSASSALARLFSQVPWAEPSGMEPWGMVQEKPATYGGVPVGDAPPDGSVRPPQPADDVASLRREVEELKRAIRSTRKSRKK